MFVCLAAELVGVLVQQCLGLRDIKAITSRQQLYVHWCVAA